MRMGDILIGIIVALTVLAGAAVFANIMSGGNW